MSSQDLFSERNVLNSVAQELGSRLMDEDYLLYWHQIDALQTPDAVYPNYRATQATYLADPVLTGRIAESKGIVTLTTGETASPRFPDTPTTDGTVSTADRAQVPTLGIDVGTEVPLDPYEAGSRLRWRIRTLTIEGRLRTRTEQSWFADKLAQWFDEDGVVDIEDHDDSSGGLDTDIVRVTRRQISRDILENLGEQDRFQVELNARLEFVA